VLFAGTVRKLISSDYLKIKNKGLNMSINNWKDVLTKLSEIREKGDYSPANVQFILEHLKSPDDRIRGAAALAAHGCIFEPYILDTLIELIENDSNNAIRKAAIKAMENLIYEGILQNFEDEMGSGPELEFYEEWDEVQTESLREDYLRVKNLFLNIIEDEFEDVELRETALIALSDLGFLEVVREWIKDFIESERVSTQRAALKAMGKFPHYWINEIQRFLDLSKDKTLVLEAISSSYSSNSKVLAQQIEQLLTSNDEDILCYALLTLGNINKTENLGEILQQFSLHPNEKVRKAAREALENFSKKSFNDFLHDKLGYKEE